MLTERFKITVKDVDLELSELHNKFLASRKILSSTLRLLKDRQAKQGLLIPMGAIADGVTIPDTEAKLKGLKELNALRQRHLTALKRVLEDEAKEIADAAQPKLPLDSQEEAG
jgi:hypothetical protein